MNDTQPLDVDHLPTLIGYADLRRDYALSKRLVQELHRRGAFPAQVVVGAGRLARWRRADVDAWVAALPMKSNAA
jgi:predicted DNA-binding transcriptional regulator AlpA